MKSYKTLKNIILASVLALGANTAYTQTEDFSTKKRISSIGSTPGYLPEITFLDYDNDGDIDILSTYANRKIGKTNIYLKENIDNNSKEYAAEERICTIGSTPGYLPEITFLDYDNDGDIDILSTYANRKIGKTNIYLHENKTIK